MRRWSVLRLMLTLAASAAVWAVFAALCMSIGSTGFRFPYHASERDLLSYRSEAVLLASLVGAGLAAAGVAYQAILRNPLADPYLLGVSSGASLAAYVWRLPFAAALLSGSFMAAVSQQAFAFAGALAAVAVVMALATSRGRLEPITLLLVGVIVNAVNGSIFLFLNSIHRGLPGSGGPLTFLVGGLQTVTASQRLAAAACVGVGWLILLYLAGQLNVAGLSEAEAEALGVRIQSLRWVALVVASLVTAAAVAVSGPIGFVGLVCPHLARLIVGTDQRRLLPVSTAMGAILLMLADAASRNLAEESLLGTQLPVGVLTGLLGGPFFLLLLWQNRRRIT